MVGATRKWIVKQLLLGEFSSERDVWRKAPWVGLKVSMLAYALNLAAHFLIYGFGLLPYDLGAALVLATLLTPPITFILAVGAYLAVGLAIHDLGVSSAELERLSRTDMLSGLANRRAFQQTFDECLSDKTLAVFDIDCFKKINDTHGHSAGDAVIAEVARTLSAVFGEQGECARIGGEEFAVFSSDVSFSEFAELCEMARIRIAAMRIDSEMRKLSVSVSGGVARALPGETFGLVFTRADKALYAAKTGGRNRIVHFGDADGQVIEAENAKPAALTTAA
ncbi:GGDEF domain-containing protein [Hoeflea sp. AS60]|uniref:GGDEF domain-containing protein n=1 Tax=Hoeflea sp. AS60 TaxID=3135780 RepID=UPI00316CFF06